MIWRLWQFQKGRTGMPDMNSFTFGINQALPYPQTVPPCTFFNASEMNPTAMPLGPTVRNAQGPNLQVHLMRFRALGRSAKKPCWRILLQRVSSAQPIDSGWNLKNLLNKFTIGSIVANDWLNFLLISFTEIQNSKASR